MQTTDNFDLKLYEGTDKFNPLLVENDNTEVIDGILYDQQGGLVESATELKSGSVHAITRTKGEAPVFRFTATANWTAGDTMTVDGTQVSVFLTNGEALGTGAYVIGTEVLASIVGTRVTVYCVSGTVEEAENALKLGGELPAYYGKAEDVETANSLAQAANTIAQATQTQVTQLNSDLEWKYLGMTDTTTPQSLPTTWKELYVIHYVSKDGFIQTFDHYILKALVSIDGGNKRFYGGYALGTSANILEAIDFDGNNNTIAMGAFFANGVNYSSSMYMQVFYR